MLYHAYHRQHSNDITYYLQRVLHLFYQLGTHTVGSCGVKFFDFETRLRLRKFFICWLRFQLRKTPRFFSLRTSDLAYISVLKFEDAHMDKKANEWKSKNHLDISFELMVWMCVWRYYLHLTATPYSTSYDIGMFFDWLHNVFMSLILRML